MTRVPSQKPLDYLRDHWCLLCGHRWAAQVVLTDSAICLSGERRVYCPRCSSPSVKSDPAEPLKAEPD